MIGSFLNPHMQVGFLYVGAVARCAAQQETAGTHWVDLESPLATVAFHPRLCETRRGYRGCPSAVPEYSSRGLVAGLDHRTRHMNQRSE